ncbi:9359_t:CDS:2 [Scutellospora calospora]|uniref:9359_t:CDS:1 n=1 Tax=Scutellospora calospora TaxID=85575 RepID=A0ACA9N2W5_9GLOM|nr:9359_t:CDS:2 [Scutellospora calospora]
MQKDQYHHYIPRYILRNFSINNYERIFTNNKKQSVSNEKQFRKQFKKKNKEEALLQVFDRAKNQLIEIKLSDLERRASNVIRDIVNASQKDCQVVLSSNDLDDLRKFLFIMDYRKPHRLSQFINEDFDNNTKPLMEKFFKRFKIKMP